VIRKFLMVVLVALAAAVAVLAARSRDEIARYRAMREM